jgi:hypothetical protein
MAVALQVAVLERWLGGEVASRRNVERLPDHRLLSILPVRTNNKTNTAHSQQTSKKLVHRRYGGRWTNCQSQSDSGARFPTKRAGFRSFNARLTRQLERAIHITVLT